MTLSRTSASALLALLLLTILGVALAPLATTPGPGSAPDTGFATFMGPRLRALLASAKDVETMVSERSRNVLALRAESERINAVIEQLDGYLDDRELSPWEREVADLYRAGADDIQLAIHTAYAALSSFDFSAIPEMIPIFSAGIDMIEEALTTLETEHDAGSSYTGIGVA